LSVASSFSRGSGEESVYIIKKRVQDKTEKVIDANRKKKKVVSMLA